jgi:hypothetical protein
VSSSSTEDDSAVDEAGTINLILLTVFLHSGELYEIGIDIISMQRCTQNMQELLWIDNRLTDASTATQFVRFPMKNLYSALSSSKAISDTSSFHWVSPMEHRVIRGATMARGKGTSRYNLPLLVAVNSGSTCAAMSSVSQFVTILTAGVVSTFVISFRDEYGNAAESNPNITFWGIEQSQGNILGGEISHILAATESAAAALSKPPIVSGLIGHYGKTCLDTKTMLLKSAETLQL